ncbi:MAG: sulfur transferase domain-containing protein [Acidobacteriota bacterium]
MHGRSVQTGFGVSLLLWVCLGAQVPQVTKETLPGVMNLARVETTVACAGATTPASMAGIKRLGFASVINLRLATENGADVEAEAAAAREAGLRYVHLPFNGASPDPAVVDQFLMAIKDPANQPAFIHCATGNRAASMWMVKRVRVDGWDVPRAAEEAAALGLTSSPLRQFVLDYLQTHPH